jgi:hypothetical protein
VPTTPVGGTPGQIQNWYNEQVIRIGKDVKKKGAEAFVKEIVVARMQDTAVTGNVFPSGAGTFLWADKGGGAFALAVGDDDKLAKSIANQVGAYATFWDGGNVTVGATKVEITYAVDQATQNPRSGKAVVTYKYITNFSGTRNGQPRNVDVPLFDGSIHVQDSKLEKMKLKESQ